jgi:UDP-N-acetylglucosamine diphosphorylase/glucosamine-1-phosphate N-acetyltransferase
MIIVLLDTDTEQTLYPLAQTKAVADIRCGIFSVKERWEAISGFSAYVLPEKYLRKLYEPIPEDEYLLIDATLKDEDAIRSQILSLRAGEALYDEEGIIAGRTTVDLFNFNASHSSSYFEKVIEAKPAQRLEYPWQLISWNDEQLRRDFLLQFARSNAQIIPDTNRVIQPENVIIEEGAVVEHCIINASTGPVYIGKNATVMEGSILRGPVAVCENAVVKAGAKIYGATTIGPYCSVGGEVKNCLLQCYSNKAHEGYLGDSVIDCWCNLGAGTSNSNVKNTGGEINVWHESSGENINVGRKFGMIMGDYNRTAINTSINSGSIIGICNNIFGEGLMPKPIGDFRWGIHHTSNYKFDKAVEHINNWKKMKGLELSSAEISVLKYIFERRS